MTLSQTVLSNDEASFDDFGIWYNSKGFERAPWLELLDLGKWPQSNATTICTNADNNVLLHQGNQKQNNYVVAFDLEAYADDGPLGEIATIDPGLLRVHFTSLAVSRLRSLSIATGLFEIPAEKVANALLQAAKYSIESGRISRPALSKAHVLDFFRSFALKKDKSLSTDQEQLLSSISYALRVRGQAVEKEEQNLLVDANQLAAGITLFCDGSKSSKLAIAWDLVANNTSKSKERLNGRGLWCFIRSFLIVLLILAATTENNDQQTLDTLLNDADAAGLTLASSVFEETNISSTADLSFDDFADWYTRGGYNRASWFELLDLHKWAL